MNLIQIGQTILNLDRVSCIRDLSTVNASGQVVEAFYRVELESGRTIDIGQDALPFRQWLTSNVTVVPTGPPHSVP